MPALRISVGLVVNPLMYGLGVQLQHGGLVGAIGEDLDLQIFRGIISSDPPIPLSNLIQSAASRQRDDTLVRRLCGPSLA